jgi:hypothetical protein
VFIAVLPSGLLSGFFPFPYSSENGCRKSNKTEKRQQKKEAFYASSIIP